MFPYTVKYICKDLQPNVENSNDLSNFDKFYSCEYDEVEVEICDLLPLGEDSYYTASLIFDLDTKEIRMSLRIIRSKYTDEVEMSFYPNKHLGYMQDGDIFKWYPFLTPHEYDWYFDFMGELNSYYNGRNWYGIQLPKRDISDLQFAHYFMKFTYNLGKKIFLIID